MKRVLIISHGFPPLLEARSIQIAKILRHLRPHGWDPVVLTVQPERTPIATDEGLCDLLPVDLEVHRTGTFESQFAISLLSRSWSSLLHLPDKQIGWLPFATRKAQELLSRGDIDCVLTNAKPFTDHLIGRRLRRRFDTPWVAYFSDPWVDSPYFQRTSDWQVAVNRRMQRSVVAEADGLLFNNPETLNQVAGDHAAKASILPHCYDLDLFADTAETGRNGRLKLVHTGNFYGLRSPLPLLEAVEDLDADLWMVGKIDPEHRQAISDRGYGNRAKEIGSVSYLQSLAYMQQADVLISVDAPVEGESVFFPSKLVDYFGTGKPVVGITPEGSTTSRVLKEHGHFVADVNDIEDIAKAVKQAAARTSRPFVPPPEFDAERTAGRLAEHLDGVRPCAS